MKYNGPIDLHENEVHAMALQKIRKGSKVLEFGAASGRMTELLSKEYGCTVYIVEYEQAAFEMAMRYADDGICADIEECQWKKWAGAEFDYILFGDVLEHLRNPKKALQETLELLKDDGSVLISVPNICHNDILVKLYYNKFEYTDVGLLDDTHIRFFSEKTLDGFVAGTGYVIVCRQYKTLPTGATEQYHKEPFQCGDELYRLLQKRENGEVYQFFMELKKETLFMGQQGVCQEPVFMPLYGLVYFDRGNGFSQGDVKEIIGHRVKGNEYEFKGKLALDGDVKRIRIDPAERQACRLVHVACSLGAADIPQKITFDGKEIIMDKDPQLIWDVPQAGVEVSYVVRFCLDMEGLAEDIIRHDSYLGNEKAALEEEKKILEEKLSLLEQENSEYAGRLLLLEKELAQVYSSRSWRYTKILRKMHAWALRQ